MQKQETELANKEPNIKSKTNWEPKKTHHTVETFIEAANKDIVERFSDTKKLPKNQLTDTDKNAIEYFWKRNDLVITKEGKGGATVILDVNDYIAKTNEQLQDNSFYQNLNVDPTAKHSDIVKSAIESFRKQELLSSSTASKLNVDEIRTPQFHIFPKVHKTNIPGRPVVNSVECHTSKISKFADHCLQPHAKSLPSYIQDTSDFINRISETIDINKDTILVTLDVKSLYTNISNHEGIEAVKSALNSVSQKPIATKVIIKFLFLILTLNNFVFNGIHYLQKIGCAMGTVYAPNYANIFMGKFEKTYIYPYINQFSNFYCRFIDDIFFISNGTVIQLQEFIKKLNNHHPTIKFDFKFSKTSIEFLYTTVYRSKEQNKLLTTVYCKPIDRRNFLHYTSAHPRSLIKSIPYNQALRLKKICAETSDLSKNQQVLKESFINRLFEEKFLDTEFQRISEIERDALQHQRRKKKIKKEFLLLQHITKTLPNVKADN